MKLDSEEQEILDTFERGEWQPVADQEREIRRHQAYARNTPYQTLIASIRHRFVAGRLVDTRHRRGRARS